MAETETMEKVSFFKKHKKLIIAFGVIAALGAAGFFGIRAYEQKQKEAETPTYEFIRTVTLEKGSLEDVVTATGTVASGNTSTVTYSSGMGYSVPKVKEVNVAVGDLVNEGDVIVTLDTESIQKSIDDEIERMNKTRDKAKETYDDAVEAYEDANDAYEDYEDDYYDAKREYNSAKSDYNTAKNSVASFQAAYNTALSEYEAAGKAYNRVMTTVPVMPTQENEEQQQPNPEEFPSPILETEVTELTPEQAALADYLAAADNLNKAKELLDQAKINCNYAVYEATYNAKKQIYDSMENGLDQLEMKLKSAEKARDSAKEAYEDSLESSDILEDLYEDLDECSLKAETSGKVTALNVSVGDTPAGVIATIQDTDSLIIKITIAEADINDVSLGMTCHITSDATEGNIRGRLTQIDPVSSQGGVFGAEVTVLDENTGLLVGMNASVDIVLSSTDDCFTVPYDAVGTDENGSFIYRSTGGEGVNMIFEQVYVTTGEQNDYYIEISGANLKEGDIIRASADLTLGIESTEEQNDYLDMMNSMSDMGMEHMGGAMNGEPPRNMPGGSFGG